MGCPVKLSDAIAVMQARLVLGGDKDVVVFQVDESLLSDDSTSQIYLFIASEIQLALERQGRATEQVAEDPDWQAFIKGRNDRQ